MAPRKQLERNQARKYALVIHELLRDVFETGKPADRIIAARFRASKNFGSRDRRTISDTAFSILRWWGWLRQYCRENTIWKDDQDTSQEWQMILFAAHVLDYDKPSQIALVWKENAGLTEYIAGLASADLLDKAELLKKYFGGARPKPGRLVPNWTWKELPLPSRQHKFLLDILGRRAPMWIRIQRSNKKKVIQELLDEGMEVNESKHLPNAVHLGNPRVNLYELESFKKGRYEVQDFASQVIGYACQAKPGQRWWDACAGAGGKSLQLASMMESKGTIVASDIREYKLLDLKKRARRGGFSNITTKPWVGNKLPVKSKSFDGVLVDAPCSCTGTWRRNPDARWTSGDKEAAELAEIQIDILDRSAKAVKPGGFLVYATCSMCTIENEDVVAAFLTKHPEYQLDKKLIHPITSETCDGMIRIWPWDCDSDATFVARFVLKK